MQADDVRGRPGSRRDNGITALRLFLAIFILIVHAWPIGGFGRDPVDALTDGRLGGGGVLAVAAFFGLSGYLLVFSRNRQDPVRFIAHRTARIVPAYIAVVLATSAVLGPTYLGAAWLPAPGVGGITSAVWEAHPTSLVNASLWTLWPELCCYAVIAVTPSAAMRVVIPALGLGLVALEWLSPGVTLAATIVVGPTAAFLAGAAIALWHDRLPMSLGIGVAGGLVAVWLAASPLGPILIGVAVAYLAVVVGLRLPMRWRTDLSYGTYLIAFPISQALVEVGVGRYGPVPLAAASLALVLPIAAVSWFVVERPMLAIGTWFSRSRLGFMPRREPSRPVGDALQP